MPTLERIFAGLAALLICTQASSAADLHPIVEVQSGYLFGAISDGKWIKADETAKLIGDETTYRVYGLTQALGDAKGDKPKPADGPCEETLAVSLSPETGKGRGRNRGTLECATAKTTSDRSNSKNVCGRCARIFANKENRPTESED